MHPDRYREVKQAFAEVLAAPAAEREAVLWRVCGDDGDLRREVEALLAHDATGTAGILGDKPAPADTGSRPSSSFAGDFAPGEVLIGRYRIVALVGEGGMGQVYLADDLVLGQPVAVKFLPEHLAARSGGLERFRSEVRHAREVTHPNVARVHDIGEVDGRHFLTMEFVDGEDLASLIKRIGRLPHEKASQIAQQICSALGEAHRRGVLHRDLKPANVMLDGEGRVRLTDFGLAVVAGDAADAGLAGTPQYMAPEQLSGVSATVQSEVYSLGLLLYELYTGKRALHGRTLDELRREHEDGGPDPPSSQLAEIDPGVETVLSRCLARMPEERPGSVLEVARALPGGDPLAAAIAAGETPAPGVVAAAEAGGGLERRRGLALLGAGILSLLALVLARVGLGIDDDLGQPSAILRQEARELAEELTGERFPHEIHWYVPDRSIAEANRRDGGASAAGAHWSGLLHHSRFGPYPFVANGYELSAEDPVPGPDSVHLVLDAEGTLLRWTRRVATDATTAPPAGSARDFDWGELLERAGVDTAELAPAEPTRIPEVFATDRKAWVSAGSSAAAGGEGLRIEVASFRGRPVHFEVLRDGVPLADGVPVFAFGFVFLSVTVAAVFLAWRNIRNRRADVRGALMVGLIFFLGHFAWVFALPVPDDIEGFFGRLWVSLQDYLGIGASVTLVYLALEPFVRRRWPRTMISWNRLLESRTSDPRVGREILTGLVVGPAVLLAALAVLEGTRLAGIDSWSALPMTRPSGIEGPLKMLCSVIHIASDSIFLGMIQIFILVLLRSAPRMTWVGTALWVALITGLAASNAPWPPQLVLTLAYLFLLTRVGMLAALAVHFSWMLCHLPLTLTPADWYFPSSFVVLATFVFVGVWSFRTATSGKDGVTASVWSASR